MRRSRPTHDIVPEIQQFDHDVHAIRENQIKSRHVEDYENNKI